MRSTTEIRSSALIVPGNVTRAFSVAKLTVAVTPSSLLSFFSIRAAQEAHVIPPTDSSTLRSVPPGRPVSGSVAALNVRYTPSSR